MQHAPEQRHHSDASATATKQTPSTTAASLPKVTKPRSAAARIHGCGGAEVMRIDEVPVPAVASGQVLVRVMAAGVNALDWKVREGFVRDAYPLTLPATLGIELAGVVAQVGAEAIRFKVGGRVMGPLGEIGAYADYVAVDEATLS